MRERRQLASGQTTSIADDTVALDPNSENLAVNAPLAHTDRLWPGGVVDYVFHERFPIDKRNIVREAMDYITKKVPCIKFEPWTDNINYVTIYDGISCSTEIGRVGGPQNLELNR